MSKKPRNVMVHRFVVTVVDHESYGSDEFTYLMENIDHVKVQSVETTEVLWTDDHPLNKKDTEAAELARLFPKSCG